jgi:DMSO reductase anchor subunit
LLGIASIPEAIAEIAERAAGSLVVFSGATLVFCSVMIYHVTQRRFWSGWNTGWKFFGTTLLLGAATSAAISASCALGQPSVAQPLAGALGVLLQVVMLTSAFKLTNELSLLLHLGDKQQNDLKRSALLMISDLRNFSVFRLICGLAGGFALPGLALLLLPGGIDGMILGLALTSLLLLGCGELIERTLFFAAVSAPRMPGSFA